MSRITYYLLLALSLFLIIFTAVILPRLDKNSKGEVVVYVSHDQDYSQPVLEAFEKETGIKVKAVYDTEASKTVGLTNRLISEKRNPQADIFWNNEVVRTIQLKKEGVLQPYKPANYGRLNAVYRDPDGYWTGFAARARVLLVNTEKVNAEIIPQTLGNLTDLAYEGGVTIADPRFGTTGAHVAALYGLWGRERFEEYFSTLKGNGVDIAQSNGQTMEKVSQGQEMVAFTDTDDANDAVLKKNPVKMVYPDQGDNEQGTLVIPNTAMLIKGARNQENGKKLIDYLISEKTESALSFAKSAQMPLLPGVKRPEYIPPVEGIKPMEISWERIYENLDPALKYFESDIIE